MTLLSLLALDRQEGNRFRSVESESNPSGRVYGGQLMAHAVAAALGTVPPDRVPTSLQLMFLAGANPAVSTDYLVTQLQEGKRVSSRHVRGVQGELEVVGAFVSAQVRAPDRRHVPMSPAAAAGPEHAVDAAELSEHVARRLRPSRLLDGYPHPHIQYRFVDPKQLEPTAHAPLQFWIRVQDELPEGLHLHATALTYLSDWWLAMVAGIPHFDEAPDGFYLASLNHTAWFHAPARADRWLFCETDSPWANGARGLSQGRMYTQDGVLVASIAQECMQTPRLPAV